MKESFKTASGFVFLMLAVYYLFNSYQGLAFIDSGELALCSYTMGVPHSTGYPLYLILSAPAAHIFSRPITGVTVLGGLLTALAGFTFFHLSDSLRKCCFQNTNRRLFLAVPLTALLFMAPVVAAQGVTNEVYGLGLLVNLAAILSVVIFLTEGNFILKRRFMILAWYLVGLSLANHMSSIQLLPGVALVTLIELRRSFSIKTMLLYTGAFIIPLTLYAVLPIRASAIPPPIANWGDVTTWDNFIRHISGWQYQVWAFTGNIAELWANFRNFLKIFYDQFPVVILPLILVGIYVLYRRSRILLAFLMITVAVNVGLGINYGIPDIDSYYILTMAILILLVIVGFHRLCLAVKWERAIACLAGLVWLFSLMTIADDNSRRDYTLPEDYARNIMLSADSSGVILSEIWDHHGQVFYLQQAEGLRPDLRFIDKELLRRSWYYKTIENVYPDLYEKIADLVPPFLEEIEVFESGGEYRPQVLEFYFQSIINRLLTRCGPGYIDNRLSYQPQGNHFIRPQGLLYRVDTIPHQGLLPQPELVWRGRGLEEYTDRRALVHVRMIREMMEQITN
jgi:hypothetical protein